MNSVIRRLTPLECERLMGFPDNYLRIDGDKTPDGPRYNGCGNSWGVNAAAWVTGRIHRYDLAHGGDGIRTYATVCSGVEAQSLALKAEGIDARGVFFSEIEKFPCRVLAHHYPDIPNLGDMTEIYYDKTKGVITNGTTNVEYAGDLALAMSGVLGDSWERVRPRAGERSRRLRVQRRGGRVYAQHD